jgi:hypothetical protein
VRPFVSPDLCPWDAAELPEWREALQRAAVAWSGDAQAALSAGASKAESMVELAEESEQYLWGGEGWVGGGKRGGSWAPRLYTKWSAVAVPHATCSLAWAPDAMLCLHGL